MGEFVRKHDNKKRRSLIFWANLYCIKRLDFYHISGTSTNCNSNFTKKIYLSITNLIIFSDYYIVVI